MPHATIHGANGRRHRFEGAENPSGSFSGTLEVAIEAPEELAPSDKRRFALIDVPLTGPSAKPRTLGPSFELQVAPPALVRSIGAAMFELGETYMSEQMTRQPRRANPPIALIGAPTDIGAGHRGSSMGPEALRVAGIEAALSSSGLRDRGSRQHRRPGQSRRGSGQRLPAPRGNDDLVSSRPRRGR